MISRRQRQGLALAVLSSVLFGTALTVAGGVFEHFSPIRTIGLRAVMAGIVLIPFAIKYPFRTLGSDRWLTAGAGLLLGIANVVVYASIDRIGVGPAAGLQFMGPAMVVVWKRVFRGVRYPNVMWLAVVFGVLGAGLLTEAWVFESVDVIGIGLGLLSGAALATFLVIAEGLGERHDGVTIATWVIMSFAICFSWLFPFGTIGTLPQDMWWVVAWLGTFGLVAPQMIEVSALTRAPSEKVALVLTLEPLSAALSAWLFLSQAMLLVQTVGMVMVLVAVIMSGRLQPLAQN